MENYELEQTYKKCKRTLEDSWHLQIPEQKIKEGANCEVDLEQGIIYYSKGGMEKWGNSIAKEVGENNGAGGCFVFGNELSHVILKLLNKEMCQKKPFDNLSFGHKLFVEAAADVLTKWMMDKMGYDGKKFTEIRQKKLRNEYGNAIGDYLQVYNSFVRKPPEELKKHVVSYKMAF